MIAQKNEAIRIAEWKRPEEYAFDERKDCGCGADSESQGQDNRQAEARCLPKLAKCEAEILGEHGSFLTLEIRWQLLVKNRNHDVLSSIGISLVIVGAQPVMYSLDCQKCMIIDFSSRCLGKGFFGKERSSRDIRPAHSEGPRASWLDARVRHCSTHPDGLQRLASYRGGLSLSGTSSDRTKRLDQLRVERFGK